MQLKLMSSVCAVALALAFAPAAWAGYDEPGIDDGNAIASDGSTATGAQLLTIPAGASAGTVAIRIPTGLATNTSLQVQLLAVDSGFRLDPAAVAATIAGEPIAVPETAPVGCLIRASRRRAAARGK